MSVVNKHFDEIDICKGIAILLVLLFHSFILYPVRLLDIGWCSYIMAIIGSFFMPVFFFVSGFLFSYSRNKSYVHVLSSKVKRLLIPYFAYELVNLFIKLMLPSLINRKVDGIDTYLYKLIFSGGELWFVYVLFLIFAIWTWVLPRLKVWQSILVVGILGILNGMRGSIVDNIFMNDKIIYFSIFFILGYTGKDIVRNILNKNIVFYVLILLFLICNVIFVRDIPRILQYILICPLIGSFFCWSLSFRLVNTKMSKYLTYCGKYSLQFYVFNGFALVPARVFICKILQITNTFIIWISISIMSIIGVILITEICKKTKVTRFVFGMK